MDREIPSVPITTLAGVASLTDLLPEMPLPSPLLQTLSNKSLLFHPRVAEEAQNLLGTREHALIPQLVHSLLQSSTDYIELKDHYASTEQHVDQQQCKPELLQAILEKNPNVFNYGPQANAIRAQQQQQQIPLTPVWNHPNVMIGSAAGGGRSVINDTNYLSTNSSSTSQPQTASQSSSETSGGVSQLSPQTQCGPNRHTPQGSPASPASARLPLVVPTVVPHSNSSQQSAQQSTSSSTSASSHRPSVITEQQVYHHNNTNNTTPSSEQQQQTPTSASPSSIVQSSYGHHHQNIATPPTPLVSSSRNQLINCTNDQVPTPTTLLHHPPSIDSSYLSGTQTSSSSCSSTETLGFTTPGVTTQNTTIVDGSHHQQSVPGNHPDYTSFHHNSSQMASSSSTSSATNNNLEQDFEQVLPVQRIQTVNALYATSETNRVPLNNPPQASSTDTSIIKAPQHNTPYSVGCFTQQNPTLQTQTSSASHDLVNSNHVTTTSNPTYPTYFNNTSAIDNNTVSRRPNTSAISTTSASASAISTVGGAISSNVSERETRQDHVIKPMNIRGPSPAQASDAPAAPSTPISFSTGEQSFTSNKPSTAVSMPQPVVRLNRITQEDQALMQRSLSEFAENRPQLASKLGITTSNQGTDESDQEDVSFEPKTTRRGTKRITDDSKDDLGTPQQTDSFTSLINVRKRKVNAIKEPETPTFEVSKPKLRKVERRFVPVLEKLSIEELMETNTYVRFSRSIDNVLKNVDETYFERRNDDDVMLSEEPLISRYQLQEVCSEAAKLKTLGAMHMIPADRLVRLLNLLEHSIRGGDRISPLTDPDDNEDIRQMWMETAMERVMSAVDASLTCMYVMTSPNMSKRVYLEDTIDRVILFIKYQLHNTIFPSFDSVYRVTSKKKVDNRKRNSRQHTSTQVREKSIVQLYNKIHELVALLAELLQLQTLTDTTVLHASSMGVAPFFVDNVSELQLSCLKLVTTIFTRYENHRRLLLDDILSSIARLPSSKRGLRSYRLLSDTEEYIQMLTALVLQLIQCVVALPETLSYDKDKIPNDSGPGAGGGSTKTIDKDILIHNKYETAKTTAGTFLTVFLGKCGNKNEDIDYRPLFENFVQDLLTTVNKPEWPASEMLLSLLGTMLVYNFTNKTQDQALRVASLDYLGVIAARIRKDAVTSSCKLETIDQMIKDIKNEEIKDGDEDNASSKSKQQTIKFNSPEEERTHFLQRVLLDYLAVNGQKDQAHRYARHFYLVQWFRDAISEKKTIANQGNKQSDKTNSKSKKSKQASDDSGSDSEMDEPLNRLANNTTDQNELYRMIEERKKFYISKIRPFQDNLSAGNRVQVLQTYIDYKSAELISQYLASKRSFSQSFDQFLKHILIVLRETSIAIRTKAIKCLTMIVEADSSVLARSDMQIGVKHSLLDISTSVREAAVDLVGKFVLSRPELIDKYYNMLLARILDTGVSVRKRVIKILKDICIECPQFHKIPEICVKMIRRVNDEEGIKKLVMEVFQNMWFTPTPERQAFDSDILLRKVMNIIDVVASSKDMGMEWFEMLLISLFKPREDKDDSTKVVSEPPKSLLTACRQIVDCLIENVLRLEEGGQGQEGGQAGVERLVACLITLYLFAKIRPQLLVKHASTLQPYLSYKCQTKLDHQIVSYVAQTLELVVPLIIHPSETFLAQLEEDAIKLIVQSDRAVVASCIACLSSIVNNVTRNFKLIRDCFYKYYGNLGNYKQLIEKDPTLINQEKYKPTVRRSMYTVGLLLRHFDFTDKDVIRDLPSDIKDQVFNMLTFYLNLNDKNIQANTLMAIGAVCVRHYDFMLLDSLKQFYHSMLVNTNSPLEMKIEVLRNIETYLLAEEMRMIKQDQEWAKRSKDENLKEMGDVSSGMASTVIQLYLKEILQSFIHPNIVVRHTAMRVIHLILQQGLVHPVQIVPYLISMSTDEEKIVSHCADKQLQDIEKKYPGFIHMKSQYGIRLSNQLQRIIQTDEIVRGYRIKEQGEPPTALNGFLYSILRNTKQQRRAIVLSILKQFDEHNRTTLSYMLYLADNLAYFPFQVQDEPLFIIHHIDIMISVSGTNLLQSFREALLPINGFQQPSLQQNLQELQFLNQQNESSENNDSTQLPSQENHSTDSVSSSLLIPPSYSQIAPSIAASTQIIDDFDEEDEADILARLPEDTQPLQSCITAAQGCLLLLVLKQHLKDTYGISDSKILQYSPTETAKVYEKAVTRKANSIFNPKATLTRLKQGTPPPVLDEVGRKDLVSQYVDFKQLMLKLDPDDDEDEDNANNKSTSTNPQSRLVGNPVNAVNNTTGNATNPTATSQTSGQTTYPSTQNQSGQISTDLSTSQTSESSPNKSFQSAYNSSSQLQVQEKDPLGGIPDTPVINLTKDSPPRVPKLVISNRRPITTVDLTSDNNTRNRSRSHRASEKSKKSRTKRKRKKILTSSGSDSDDFSDPDFLA
ncbi:nipped-B-like protein A [Chrysoperla carnea]|uniref:nipped-B-like protein A n=1 Tax=Chrysoperla carnea TaxID=189513 RepID=UPI001D066BEB|nr:nipped-B-like protein A [Chrysoperla carnea]XP_044741698.1 nipped-B-like protein A [Chrysoperla carnea]